MRLTASSLPTFTLLSASVTPAILRTEGDAREVHLQHHLLHVAGHALVSLEDLRDELLALPVSRHLDTSNRSILPAGVTRLRGV